MYLCIHFILSIATTSSSLAVSMAAQGHKVALISTDPAHSLGDAIDMDLSGGKLVNVPLVGVPGDTGDGSLSALEVDPSSALSQFKGIVGESMINISAARYFLSF
jgi:arsenite-transporting ATPase